MIPACFLGAYQGFGAYAGARSRIDLQAPPATEGSGQPVWRHSRPGQSVKGRQSLCAAVMGVA